MDSNTFMGLLIGAIAVLLAIGTALATLIIKPIVNLNQNITKLNLSVDGLNKSVGNIETRLAKHGEEIDGIRDDLKDYEGRISKMEGSNRR